MENLSDNDPPELLRTPLTSDPDWKQLIDCPLSADERSVLITAIFSNRYEVEVIEHLTRDDVQAFIDAVYWTLDCLEPHIRWKCLRFLYRNCGRHVLLPTPLSISLHDDQMDIRQRPSGIVHLRKGQYDGQVVVAKCFSGCVTQDLDRMRRRFCREVTIWGTFYHQNVLPVVGAMMMGNEFAVVSDWMENGNINMFVEAHPDANRMKLLADVARGLVHIHSQGIFHGSLKGSNVLIDSGGNACISDFSLLHILGGDTDSWRRDFSFLWTSPELIDPIPFGFNVEESRPTKKSDCYALGMVIYEVLSGRAPFRLSLSSLDKIMRGDHPVRPQGALFTDDVWEMLGLCWKHQPKERISPKTVLLRLEGTAPPSFNMDGDAETNAPGRSGTTASDL